VRLRLPGGTPAVPAPVAAGEVVARGDAVSAERGGRRVVDGVDLAVHAGEVVALVGPNGAGKSTLLSLMAGDLRPAAGRVVIDGRDVAAWSPPELAVRRAVLPQRHTLSFPFTVADVVAMGRTPWAGTDAEDGDEAAIAEAMRATDVEEFADRPFTALSGGEQARVALARVLAQGTGFLLLDEPTAALDLHHQELVLGVARRRARAGTGVLVVLHDLGLAAAHADRIVVLSRGAVAAAGTPHEVLTEDLLTDVYRHPIEVIPHPRTGTPLVIPRR